MADKPKVSYKRAPSEELLKLLVPGGDLSWLIAFNKQIVCGAELDVHFRSDDEVNFYCGLTRILRLKRLKQRKGHIKVWASDSYKQYADGLFKQWPINSPSLHRSIEDYLNRVKVDSRFTEREGAIQVKWSRIQCPWIPFDREAVFDYESTEYRVEFKQFPAVKRAYYALETNAVESGWAIPEKPNPNGRRKIDQLATKKGGQLVLLELKDARARSADSVFYAPFQLLQYVWEWHKALQCEMVRADLQKLIDTRNDLKLSPQPIPKLEGGIRAAIGFGSFFSDTDKKSQRGYKYKKVLKIVNKHRPPGVDPIETWAWKDGRPCKLNW